MKEILIDNPFYVLQATPRDTDEQLIAKALDIRLLTGQDTQTARETLLQVSGRLDAEIAFLPCTDEEQIRELRFWLEDPSGPAPDFQPASALALLNGVSALLDEWPVSDAESAAAAAKCIAGIFIMADVNSVMEDINSDREKGGRAVLDNKTNIRMRMSIHRHTILSLLYRRFEALPPEERTGLQDLLTDAYCNRTGAYYRNPVLDELVSVHLANQQMHLAMDAEKEIREGIIRYKECVKKNDVVHPQKGAAVSALYREEENKRKNIISQITGQLKKWNDVTKNTRRIIQTKGYTKKESTDLFNMVHSFFVEMDNQYHDRPVARPLIKTICEVFWDVQPALLEVAKKNALIVGVKL